MFPEDQLGIGQVYTNPLFVDESQRQFLLFTTRSEDEDV